MGIGLAQLTNSTRWKSGSLKDLRTPNRKVFPAPSAPEYKDFLRILPLGSTGVVIFPGAFGAGM